MNHSISRRTVLKSLAGTAAGLSVLNKTAPFADEKPNILFLFADDMNYRGLGCQGNPEVLTPNIDRLAREGTRFSQCHVSNPICTPSRAALMTGQYGFRNGVTFFGHRINDDSPRIAQLLSDAGYSTGYTGKWHNNGRPLNHGFQWMKHTFLGGMHDYESIPVVDEPNDSKRDIGRNPTEVFTEGALDLLNQRLDSPFAMFACYTAPHDPRTAPPEYEALYPPDKISLPENFMRRPSYDPGTLDIRDEKLLERPLDRDAVKREIARYYAMITHLDDQVGLILKSLERNGQLDNTLVIFASDNGLALGSHGLLGKQNLYEEGVRVPLVVRGPGVKAGATCDALTDIMDIMPTMCDFAGAAVPGSVQGRSLTPFLKGEEAEERDSVFCYYDDLFRMVKTKEFKLVRHLKSGKEELFNLVDDPYELKDLSSESAFADMKATLNARMDEWQKELGDPAYAG